ncbi:hypothetical protein OHA79_40630 [Streptomyces sp. NBC_00841]|uniref:hypothetical protein n=1 Tax=Streptomyces sp. NBC_00841 TaxID=2975847 RepID=UPI002DDBEE23|nr:hypothetical protein [Streptomyces sp. NBC_00841]WSA03568.1 hypothetical protein OHA79_40630 [Streptomyces sp. NBC_00841]
MADSLSDDDVLEAVARHTGRPGQGAQIRREGADITPVPMLGLTIDRSIETRTTKPVRRGGRPDLSHLPEYEGDLRDCPVDPPTDPGRSKAVEFVLRGSVRAAPCICVGGRILCKRCSTRGTLRCETGVACPKCQGSDPCTWCDGTGKRRTGEVRAPTPGAPARVRCAQCHKPGTACPGCEGKGFKVCTTCRGTGAVKCPHCDGEGSSRHDECDGTGTVTLYTAGTVAYTTRPDSLNLPEPPPPLRVRRMTALGGAWERVTLTEAGAPLPDGLDPSHLKAVESALAPRRDEVSRRAELRLLRLAQVVLRDDQDHVFYVFPGRNGPEVCSVWSRRRILRAVGVAAAAAVLLVLGLALIG